MVHNTDAHSIRLPYDHEVSARRALINVLDRRGGRSILSRITTRVARKVTGTDVEVMYDGLWMHRVDETIFPDSTKFEYHAGSFEAWPRQADRAIADAGDYWFHAYTPRLRDVIVDIGAGRGEDALCFSRAVGPEGIVVAVEANPRSFHLLGRFVQLNALRNVRAVNTVVADRTGTFDIETDADWQANSIMVRPGSSSQPTVPVAGTTVDLLCQQLKLSRIDLLKMNIEGAERLAVEGMKHSIAITRHLCIACHDFRAERGEGEQYRSREHVMEFLMAQGFSATSRCDDPRPSVRDYIYGVRK